MYIAKYWDSGEIIGEPDEILLIGDYRLDADREIQVTKVYKVIKQFKDTDFNSIKEKIRKHKTYFLGSRGETEIIPIDSKIAKVLYMPEDLL